jgi:hypothetical protein
MLLITTQTDNVDVLVETADACVQVDEDSTLEKFNILHDHTYYAAEGLAGNKSCSPSGMCASPNPIQTPYYTWLYMETSHHYSVVMPALILKCLSS